jgi:hypothetical protein
MSNQLIEIVLPQLAQRLHQQVKRYHSGELDDAAFARRFKKLLQKQYAWLANHGVPRAKAAVAIHGAVLVLTSPGLRAEAEQEALPLEVVEHRAVLAAAADIAKNHGGCEKRVYGQLAAIVATYGE